MAPYRLQIYLDPEVREALRAVAFAQHTSLQALVTQWLVERLQRLPEGAALGAKLADDAPHEAP